MPQPKGCPDELYAAMKLCWHFSPAKRINFADMHVFLIRAHQSLSASGIASSRRLSSFELDSAKPQNLVRGLALFVFLLVYSKFFPL